MWPHSRRASGSTTTSSPSTWSPSHTGGQVSKGARVPRSELELIDHVWSLLLAAVSYLQHDVFAAHSTRFRFISPPTALILANEKGEPAKLTHLALYSSPSTLP